MNDSGFKSVIHFGTSEACSSFGIQSHENLMATRRQRGLCGKFFMGSASKTANLCAAFSDLGRVVGSTTCWGCELKRFPIYYDVANPEVRSPVKDR